MKTADCSVSSPQLLRYFWTYTFTNEYCKLDKLADKYCKAIENPTVDSKSESEESETEDVTEESHEVELESLTRRRRIRDTEGNTLISYKDFAGIGTAITKRKLRTVTHKKNR